MTKVLYIEASPRKERGASVATGRALIDAYREKHPDHEIEVWDLWDADLPEFNEAAINATYSAKRGEPLTDEQQAAWDTLKQNFDRFAAADKYVLSLPMWNFGVPYKLKHFIDVVTLAGLAFRITPEGAYEGLLTGRPAAVVYASGGEYSQEPMASLDHLRPYVDLWLGFIGITDRHTVNVAPTATAPDAVQAAKQHALEEAKRVAAVL